MFSSVLDKVVSATAPGTLATFPPRADLPASSSTLCCLSFVDRFISRYPTAYNTKVKDNIDGRLLLGHAGRPAGIAISADDLESTMESAAELGGRLAAALAGTVRSKRRESTTAPVSDLLAKVRGIFGNRLTCVGREIRVLRNVQAEGDETLLLRQIHTLKNAALDACNGEKWSIVISSGGESLAVCSVPLPTVEEGGACGCDFLIFDPSPRPAMKLRGSYIVKFTTVRGLQLHLLSALGEIWRGRGLPQADLSKKEFVGLSVVMAARGKGEAHVDGDSRRLLEDSVTSLRKAEKAAVIKIKREEVEALRRALKKPSQQKQLTHTAFSSGDVFGSTDGAVELQQGSNDNDLRSGSACPSHSGAQGYRHLEPPRELPNRSTFDLGISSSRDGDIEQLKLYKNDPSAEPPQKVSDSAVPHFELQDEQSSRDHNQEVFSSRKSSGGRPKVRPPIADISPPLSVRTSEREEGQRCWSEENGEIDIADRGFCLDLPGAPGTVVTGGVVGGNTPGARGVAPLASGEEEGAGVEGFERGSEHGVVDGSTYSRNRLDEEAISDNPLHRALLRSIEGEGLAEYSKRAYSVYRTHGVIQDESGPDDHRPPESAAHELSLSVNQLYRRPALSPPAGHLGMVASSTIPPCETSSSMTGPADGVSIGTLGRKEFGLVNVGVREPVRPFSPPPASLQTLECQSEGKHPSSTGGKRPAVVVTPGNDDDLRVIDLSEAEDVALNKPDKQASPREGFRSRLRAPRAGRVLALTSAHARGNHGCRQAERSRNFRRDLSDSQFLPTSPPATATAVPTRPKEAWTKEGQQQHDLHAMPGRHEPELACLRPTGGTALIFSDEDDDDGVFEHSDSALKKAMAPSRPRDSKSRPSQQLGKSRKAKKERSFLASEVGVQMGGNIIGRESHQRESSTGLDLDRQEKSEDSSDGECTNKARTSKERSTCRSTAVDGCNPISTTAAGISPQRQANTTRTTKIHRKQGDGVQPHVSCLERVSGGEPSVNTVLAEPSLLDTGVTDLHRSRNGKTAKGGDSGDTVASPDNEEFVWFGEPGAPLGRQPAGKIEATTRFAKERETAAEAAAEAAAGAAVASEPQFDQHSSTSRQQQQRAKAQLVLQMEVRRQRDIIERAFRAREEEGRLRKARIRAEVLHRIKSLLHRRSPSPPEAETAPFPNAPSAQQATHGSKPEPPSTADQVKTPQVPAHRAAEMSATSPPHPETDVKAWGFGPAIVKYPAENTSSVKAVQPQVLVPEVAPPDGAIAVRTLSAGDNQTPESQSEGAPDDTVAAENPWGRVVSQTQAEHKGRVPGKTEPIPPPISFDVEANDFRDGAGWLDGGTNQGQEKARRQARYEALRARKMAEAEERKRSQRERQAAARVEQRRKSAAAAATTAVTTGEGQRGEDNTKNDPRRQNPAQHGSVLTDEPPQRNNTPWTSTVRPHVPSRPNNEDRLTGQGTSSLEDGKGGPGGGGTRLSTPSSGRIASPAVRGFSRRSNRKLVRNAINFLCLAGGHLEEKKTRALQALDSHPGSNFVVLLAHTKLLSFKGLYACSGEEDGTADRVFGLGPPQIDATVASGFYKYNSAAREFREVRSKTLGKTTDAISMEPTRLKRPKGLAMQ
ncbi:unnamed protein product [Pylaiella littoralis]